MIHLTLLIPLVIAGTASAIWREYKQNKDHKKHLLLGNDANKDILIVDEKKDYGLTVSNFDDIGELTHYQRVAWYSLAFSTAGVWFYPPVILFSLPLLGYNSYQFTRVVRNSDKNSKTSPLTVFEMIGVGGTLLTGHAVLGSIVLVSSFSMRKLFLQGNNLTQLASNHIIRMKYASMWVLRDGIEVEISLADLQSNDIFILHEGDIALAEGVVVKGTGVINQYSLQKTMKFIHKEKDDKVFPFTKLQEGCLHIQKK